MSIGYKSDDVVGCPACDAWMPRGGTCPDCGHADRVDCDCEFCERLAASGEEEE